MPHNPWFILLALIEFPWIFGCTLLLNKIIDYSSDGDEWWRIPFLLSLTLPLIFIALGGMIMIPVASVQLAFGDG